MKKRRFGAVVLTLAFALSMTFPVTAGAAVKSITITGKNVVYVGNKIELDTKILPAGEKVRDNRIVWTSSNPSVAKVLETRDDDTTIKGIKAGKVTITVKIEGTEIKDTYKITVKAKKKSTVDTSADKSKISDYRKKAKKIKSDISKTILADTTAGRKKQYRAFEKRIEAIEDKLEILEEKWENRYENGKVTRAVYRSMEQKIESVEDYLETVEDALERKFNYEFDD